MSQPGDPEVNVSASDRAALGSFRSIHPAGSSMHRTNITILSVFTLLLAGPAVACVIIALFRKPGTGFFITAAVLGVVALLPAVVLYLQIRKLRWRLYLFDNGFVFARGTDRAIR
jgi:hypothetical protein